MTAIQTIGTGNRQLIDAGIPTVPMLFARAGEKASRRVLEFFTAQIRNRNTRLAYGRAVGRFAAWCDERRVSIERLEPMIVARYVEELSHEVMTPSVKQHLAAIRMLFDWLVIGQVVPFNPAASVRGPKYVVKKGKTPVLQANEARELLDAIDTSTIAGLRDRALIGVMVYSFARVSAVVGMNVEDFYPQGKRWWLRFHEKGSKEHAVPVHHNADQYLEEYLAAAGIGDAPHTPLFRSLNRHRQLTDRRMHRNEVLDMVKRRARAAGLPDNIGCHTWRATGITAYLKNGGSLETAQQIAGHESPRTTKLYARLDDEVTLDEIEKIMI